ncbi:unnamed protein product [Diabrotica balteata]|uniref:Uncharacterized protein n=1 Tax=Diabrotica balteata TaxID=107213 RepID=A0A9N9STD9_DIABA|nr:unnamed protein product [Diabrotica balteata]
MIAKTGKLNPEMKKKEIKKRAKNLSEVQVYAVDVQKVLTCPNLKTSTAYYKTKLKVHNWTIYNLAPHQGTCYVWHEGNRGVKSDVFASMIVRFLKEELKNNQVSMK